MTEVSRRETRAPEIGLDVLDRFERMLDEWTRMMPFRRPLALMAELADTIRVDEFREGDDLVVRAELPGIDPEKDVDVSVTDSTLRIEAQRREEEKTEEKGYMRRELRYGSFTRVLPLPEGVAESEIKASYKDGILEIRIPARIPEPAKRIPVQRP